MARMLLGLLLMISSSLLAAEPVPPDHAERMKASAELFKSTLREYFEKNCLECHGGAKTKSGFSLATRETMLAGGDRGIAVVPGKSATSDLVKYMAREAEPHMPPKNPAPKTIVQAVAKWIDLGAAYDKPLIESAGPAVKKPLEVTDKDRQYWAYRPLQQVREPKAGNWSRTIVDRFIEARWQEKTITPSADVDRATLLRRVTFDLTGLPPTRDELQQFLADKSPTAYEKVVDRLLASEAFGERWARHWLDPARYAESHGFEHDYFRPNAYHYRDFVIKAFNQDMPYDQFVRWQLAGDELAPDNPLALAATGFLGAGVYPTQITTREAERVRYDAMDDMLATTGHAMLALTVGCARCHDHKYDPIPTRDYYRLLSAFTTTVRSEVPVTLGTPEQQKELEAFEARLKNLQEGLAHYEAKDLGKNLAQWIADRKSRQDALPKIADANASQALQALMEGKATLEKLPKPQRDALQKWYSTIDPGAIERRREIAEWHKKRPNVPKVVIQATTEGLKPMRHHTAIGSIPDFYPKTFLLKRGDTEQKEGEVSLGFLQVLTRHPDGEKHWLTAPPAGARTSFRRTSLANWIVDVEAGAGALAARVIVNRLWHHHFGRGFVPTLNDFGFQSEPPTHPELLEWLAQDLIKHGWKLKRLHKMMVMSRVYQLSGTPSESGKLQDPENKLWHSRPRQRLEAEAIRDSLLAVTGELDRTLYGPGTLDQKMKRRSIYFSIQRSQLIPFLQAFDWPDTLTSASARANTIVAPQALIFLNNPAVREWSASLAKRLHPVAAKSLPDAITQAYETAFSRSPNKEELATGVEFLKLKTDSQPLERALQEYVLVLLSLNEFVYLD